MASGAQRWAAWQLLDSALPTGGFAHSQGLEAAAQSGWVDDRRAGVELFCLTSLQSQASLSLPYVLRCQRAASALAPGSQCTTSDEATETVMEMSGRLHRQLQGNHVAQRASAALGVSLLRAAKAAFGEDSDALGGLLSGLQRKRGDIGCHQVQPQPHAYHRTRLTQSLGHLQDDSDSREEACVFGAVAGGLGFPPEETAYMFLFLVLRDTLSAATRLNLVGPMEAAGIQRAVGEATHQMAQGAVMAQEGAAKAGDGIAGAANSAPVLELLQCNHDMLYSRLFSS